MKERSLDTLSVWSLLTAESYDRQLVLHEQGCAVVRCDGKQNDPIVNKQATRPQVLLANKQSPGSKLVPHSCDFTKAFFIKEK